MDRNSNTYYYHYDGLGSVTEITDASGAVQESYKYSPYGNPSIFDSSGSPITSTAIGNPYMFTGRRWDDETAIYYYRARMYDPALGRFLQRDPLGYWDSMNLYTCVVNNPVNFVDPLGLFFVPPPPSFPNGDDCSSSGDEGSEFGDMDEEDLEWAQLDPRGKPIIRPEEPSTLDQMLWGLTMGGIAKNFRGPEWSAWKDKGTDVMNKGKWHFHFGSKKSGLGSHHLPYESQRWFRNLWGNFKRSFKWSRR